MKKRIPLCIFAVFVITAQCARVDEAVPTELQGVLSADGCTITSSSHKGYYFGFNSCGSDNQLKQALQKKIRNHKVLKYTDDISTVPSGYNFQFITDGIRYMENFAEPVPTRFDVWDYFMGLALKGIKPSNVTCPSTSPNRVYEYYSGYCYIPAGTVTAITNIPVVFSNPSQQQTLMNREHTWPKSWFDSPTEENNASTGNYCFDGNSDSNYSTYYDYRAFTDIHHLLPTNATANTTRNNNPFGIVDVPSVTYTGAGGDAASPATGGKSGTPHHSNITSTAYTVCGGAAGQVPCTATTVFEPPDHVKGDIARIYFYMATRYYTEDTCWITSDATDKATIKQWQETMLKKWHSDDPVDDGERKKNDLIHRIQGNRNPFVDHPEWVAKISDF